MPCLENEDPNVNRLVSRFVGQILNGQNIIENIIGFEGLKAIRGVKDE